MSVEDFITRSELGTRLDTCCRRKAEKELGEERNKTLSLDEVTANIREEFGRSARGYVAHLLKSTQSLTRFTSDIVRGLGSFDLKIMLIDPLEQATYCFKQLFTSFRLRGIFQSHEEALYLEEYLSFIDDLRRSHPDVQQPKLLIADAVNFITEQDALKTRRNLAPRIFRLSCLCLDEPRLSFPAVNYCSVNTDDPTNPMFDVVAPIQSYFGEVARGLDTVTSDESIARLLTLEATCGTTGLSNTYSPWNGFDYFGRDRLRDAINPRSPKRRKVVTHASDDQPCSSKSPKEPHSSKVLIKLYVQLYDKPFCLF